MDHVARKKRQAVLEALREKVSELPVSPGVYLLKDAAGVVLYVGKAKSLRPRVASYFQPAVDLAKTRGPDIERMIQQLVCDVDVLVCDSEVDALLRENRLVKDIQPRFNERLKDGKSFPYLQITTREDFPRVSITREPQASWRTSGRPCRCSSASSSSARASSRSTPTTPTPCAASGRASCTASSSARRRAPGGSRGTTTASRSAGCASSWSRRRRRCAAS